MKRTTSRSRTLAVSAMTGLALSTLSELRVGPVSRTPAGRWRQLPIRARRNTELGISFRPRQCEDFDLDPQDTLHDLLSYPFELIRLSAYWDRIESAPGAFETDELDWQLEAAERAGKQVIVCLGAVKSFGYPEYFVPPHRLEAPLPEGTLIDGRSHADLLDAATEHLVRLVRRYRKRSCIVAWQVEHEAVDPLGVEHSWRLAASFVQREVKAVRAADPSRPVLLNGFLPSSTMVLAHQWWRTRDQGDSLATAARLADIVGIDHYPRHALAARGPWGAYVDGRTGILPALRRNRMLADIGSRTREAMVTEGQAEPWESVTRPPSPAGRVAASCPPERIIQNYNDWTRWSLRARVRLQAYLFWGAEYWVLRAHQGDSSYLDAFSRVVKES